MRRLTVLTDPRCRVCRRLREHLACEPTWVPLLLATHAAPADPHAELLVLGEGGEVWSGENAWRMVLWAQRATRRLARTSDAARLAKAEHDGRLAGGQPPVWSREPDWQAPAAAARVGPLGATGEVVRAVVGGVAAMGVLVGIVVALLAFVYLLAGESGGWAGLAVLVGLVLWAWSRAGRAAVPPPRRLG